MDSLYYLPFSEIDLEDNFFNSLRADYSEFSDWFERKASQGEHAYVLVDKGAIDGFMYLKKENDAIEDLNPPLPTANYLKVGTFKFNSHGTRRGERFIKKIFDHALEQSADAIYVTVFDKHEQLKALFSRYGFTLHGMKETSNGIESVLVRWLKSERGSTLESYPFISVANSNNHLLAIYPKFHTRLLPDSILNNETHDEVKDVSHTNSIHKIYICGIDVSHFKKGDNLVIYRTTDNKGSAWYRSVATSVCVVEGYNHIDEFPDIESFMRYCEPYSVFTREELTSIYRMRNYCHIIRFSYNAALTKRITRGDLVEKVGLESEPYWGLRSLTDYEFKKICSLGEVNEGLIVD